MHAINEKGAFPQEEIASAIRPNLFGRWGWNSPKKLRLDEATFRSDSEKKSEEDHIPAPEGFRANQTTFGNFTRRAKIRHFDRAKLPQPKKPSSFNDDVKIEHFQISSRHYAGKQRRGAIGEHIECLALGERVDKALHSPFFLSLSAPLPESIVRAAKFNRDSDPGQVAHFWDMQLLSMGDIIAPAMEVEQRWRSLIPPETAAAIGKIRIARLILLADQCGIGGASRPQQFIFGPPLVGMLSRRRCFPTNLKEGRKKAEPIRKIMKTSASRFADRANKAGHENAKALRGEDLAQREKGWANRPFRLSLDRHPFVLNSPELNIAFRFGVEQIDKLRACDDLRHARTNLASVVQTPIKRARWGHVADLTNLVNDGKMDLSLSKADREAAYKQLPLDSPLKACSNCAAPTH